MIITSPVNHSNVAQNNVFRVNGTGSTPRPNRAEARRRNQKGLRSVRFSLWLRLTAIIAIISLWNMVLPPSLIRSLPANNWLSTVFSGSVSALFAQPTFNRFEEQSKNDANRYVERASRLTDADVWTNYVELGIASEFIEWEEESLETLREEFQRIDETVTDEADQELQKDLAASAYENAALQWELEAEDYFLNERGEYRAEQATLAPEAITEEEYAALIADVQADFAALTDLDLTSFDAALNFLRDPLQQRFEDSLQTELDRERAANAALTGDERAAFEAQLNTRAAEIRQEFDFRDHFYVLSARNTYVAERRDDDLNARLQADQSSADSVSDQVIADTVADLNQETGDLLDAANTEIADLSEVADLNQDDFNAATGDWEQQMEAVISSGLRKWEEAEEDLYGRRLAWLEESKRSRAEGERIWESNHEKLKEAREGWIVQLQEKITEGRQQWEQKFVEFADSRAAAEQELQDFITAERQRRDAALDQLGDMVRGGGSALVEAKDAFAYYSDLMNTLDPGYPLNNCASQPTRDVRLYCFYRTQRDMVQTSMGNFQRILASSEGVLWSNMHSDDNATGFLNDRRVFAGTLPDEIAALGTGDFRDDLATLMAGKPEDFLLYQRDIGNLIEGNELFASRVRTMQDDGVFDPAGAGTLDELVELLNGLDAKYDDHAREIAGIIVRDRGAIDDATRLSQIKSDIADWFTASRDENARLKTEVTEYFTTGLSGFYLSENENDPYLMTKAEYEWELLRRERNYLAKRLRRAEEVKRYADLAANNEAGLEMAAITAERADVAKTKSDIREVMYALLKGDIALDPAVTSDIAIRDSEYLRLLSERGIDAGVLLAHRATLETERDIFADAAGLTGTPTTGDIDALTGRIDAFLTTQFPNAATVATEQTAIDQHRLTALRGKLLSYRNLRQNGDATAGDRWTVVRTSANVVETELVSLYAEYDFAAPGAELDRLRVAVGERSVDDLSGDVADVRTRIEANAVELAAARTELEQAKLEYREARIDYDVLRAANSEDLIRIDLTNNSQSLASVLNRMVQLENIPGLTDRLVDPLTERRTKYLIEVSEREKATRDFERSDRLYSYVSGLEESKKRLAELTTVIAGLGANPAPEATADALIAAEAQLVERLASDEELRSGQQALITIDSLKAARTELTSAQTALDDAVSAGTPAAGSAEYEILRRNVAVNRESLTVQIERLAAAIRGEEQSRRHTLLYLLEGAAGAPTTPEQLTADYTQAGDAFNDRSLALSKQAALDLRDFLTAHQGESFAQLLTAINDQIASGPARTIRLDLSGYERPTDYNADFVSAAVIRDWLTAQRAAIDQSNAAPDSGDEAPGDTRDPATKWTALLKAIQDFADDAGLYESVQNMLPDNASDAWVVDYRASRTGLATQLDTVLANGDASLTTAYDTMRASMSDSERANLARYGLGAVAPAASGAQIRAALERGRQAIGMDLASIDRDFRGIYVREQLYATQVRANEIQRIAGVAQQNLLARQGERDVLLRDRATLEAAIAGGDATLVPRLADVNTRITELDGEIAVLEPQVTALADELRGLSGLAQELQQPGSSAAFYQLISSHLSAETAGIEMQSWTANRMGGIETDFAERRAEREITAADQLKAAIGFYRTNERGVILRNSDGEAIVSDEFIALGATGPGDDLMNIIAGGRTGSELETYSRRLIAFMADPAKNEGIDPELQSAVELLEKNIREVLAARKFIEERDTDAATLLATSNAEFAAATERARRLNLLAILESELATAAGQAQQSGGDAATALLAVLSGQLNNERLFLFEGYHENGEYDGVADVELQARADEIRNLADRLRETKLNSTLIAIADRYGELQTDYMARLAAGDPAATFMTADAYLDIQTGLKAAPTRDAVAALADDDSFRENLWAYLGGAPPEYDLYRDAIIVVLARDRQSGVSLKAAVLAAIDGQANQIDATIRVFLGESETLAARDRDFDVTASVAQLIQDHATSVGANVLDTEMQAIAADLYQREMRRAIAVSDAAGVYEASDYPEELREFVLVRQYQNAEDRYNDYLATRAADSASASLDLRGLGGEFANSILIRDFSAYMAANGLADYHADTIAAGGTPALADYFARYLEDRNTTPEQLPGGGQAAYEWLALSELRRATDDGAGGVQSAALADEREFAGDLQTYILVTMAKERAGALTLSGATLQQLRDDYRPHFEALLDDPAYSRAGKTIRQRLLNSASIDSYFELAFAYISQGAAPEFALPDILEQRRQNGTLDETPPAADTYRPAALYAIAGYAGLDYQTMIAAIHPAYAEELARQETLQAAAESAAGGEYASLTETLQLDDAEVDTIIARAGYAGASVALRDELRGLVRAAIPRVMLASSQVQAAEQALQLLRQERALAAAVPNAAALQSLELFYAREGIQLQNIQTKALLALQNAHADLAIRAETERADVIRAAIERSRGGTTAYYNGLSAELQTAVDAYANLLFGGGTGALSAAEQAAIYADAAGYEQALNVNAARELAQNPLLQQLEQNTNAAIQNSGDAAVVQYGRENQSTVLAYYAAYLTGGAMPSVPANVASALTAAADRLSPDEREIITRSGANINLYLSGVRESDAERRQLETILDDPRLVDPGQRLNPRSAAQAAAGPAARELNAAISGFLTTLQQHGPAIQAAARRYGREQAMAAQLRDFARERGDDLTKNRFVNYRTHAGAEDIYQKRDYAKYLVNNGADPDATDPNNPGGGLKTFYQHQNGSVLVTETMPGLDALAIFDGDWENLLRSDDPNNTVTLQLGTDTASTADDRSLELNVIRRVSDAYSRPQGNDTTELQHTYYENLANNYLEAISRLNATLRDVVTATKLADERHTTDIPQSLQNMIGAGYDVDAAANVNDTTNLLNAKQDAQSRLAIHSQDKLSETYNAVGATEARLKKAAKDYGNAARRNQLRTILQATYIEDIFTAAATRFEAAEAEFNQQSQDAENLELEYAAANKVYLDGLNEMAGRYRSFEDANDAFEERLAVKDFAETPYLVNVGQDDTGPDLTEYSTAAQTEYERALALVEQANQRMRDAAFTVQTEDNIGDFNAIVAGLEASEVYPPLGATERTRLAELREKQHRQNETLDAAESAEMTALTHREMYERYGDLIRTRAEHIKHTMRMVRLHKASELIEIEINRRERIAEAKKQKFNEVIDANFGTFANQDDQDARNAVYARLAGQVEGGIYNFQNEFKGWFWGGQAWASTFGGAAQSAMMSGANFQITPLQILEGWTGNTIAGSIPGEDRAAIGRWLGAGGSVLEYMGFQGVYSAYLMSLGQLDAAFLEDIITKAVWYPVYAAAKAVLNSPAALYGGVYYAYPTMVLAKANILRAQAKLMVSAITSLVLAAGTFAVSGPQSVINVMGPQREYENALADLHYFTKADDLQTVKERMIQWGAQHADSDSAEALYNLTDEDLKYLFDRNGTGDAVYADSTGAAQTLTAEEQSDAFDASSLKETKEFRDSLGNYYDPTQIVDGQPGPLVNGAYRAGDGSQWVRIKWTENNGATRYRFAKRIDRTAAAGTKLFETYNMGRIFDALVSHGETLRDDRRDAYIAAGDAAITANQDSTFIYNERDATYQNLFEEAGADYHGGREFSGYTMTYEEYETNQRDVMQAELERREGVQLKEWELREQELQDRYTAWETKMAAVIATGRSAWGNADGNYLQKWREWERNFDKDVAEGKEAWDGRIKTHFEKKEQWEQDIRTAAAENTIENAIAKATDELNSQVSTFAEFQGMQFDRINKAAFVNEAVEEMKRTLPGFSERFNNVNKSIEQFNTRLSTSELTGTNITTTTDALGADYREEMRQHKHNMKVQANVKVFEEYRKLIESLKLQIDTQNRQIEMQTQAAAYTAGFVKAGANFIKTGSSSQSIGYVDSYQWYDVETRVDSLMTEVGFSRMSDDALFEMLETKDNVEVEAFFYTQKLAVQLVLEKVMGKGTNEERKKSKDKNVIGEFGAWAGRAPGSDEAYQLAGQTNQLSGLNANQSNALKYGAFGGFGEQGVFGLRPSGRALGFYPQLDLASQEVGKADAKGIANAGGTIDPISATLNSLNPIAMFAKAQANIQIGSKVGGKSTGHMLEAQLLDAGKGVLQAIGPIIATLGNLILPGVALAIGTAMVALGNAIQVNPTSGERGFKMTQQGWVNTGVTLLSGLATMGAGAIAGAVYGASTAAASTATTVLNVASQAVINTASAGMQFDADGKSSGFSLKGAAGTQAAIGIAVSAAGQGIGKGLAGVQGLSKAGQSVLGGLSGKLLSNTISYGQHISSGGKYGGYNAIQRGTGLGGLGGIVGMGLGAYEAETGGVSSLIDDATLSTTYGKNKFDAMIKTGSDIIKNNDNPKHQLRLMHEAGVLKGRAGAELQQAHHDVNMARARKAADHNNKQQAAEVLQGLGYSQDQRKKMLAMFAYQKADTGVTDAAYRLRAAAGIQNGIKSTSEGQRVYSALEADLRAASASGKVSMQQMEQIAAKHGISAEMLYSGAAVQEANRLQGNDVSRTQMGQAVGMSLGEVTRNARASGMSVNDYVSAVQAEQAKAARAAATSTRPGERMIIKDTILGKNGALGWLDSKLGTNLTSTALTAYNHDNMISNAARGNDMAERVVVNQAREAWNTAKNADWGRVGMNSLRVVGGGLQVYGGAIVAAAGAAASATLVGAIAGVPMMAVGGFMVANGAADIAMGGYDTYRAFADPKSKQLRGNIAETYEYFSGEKAGAWMDYVDMGAGLVGSITGLVKGGVRLSARFAGAVGRTGSALRGGVQGVQALGRQALGTASRFGSRIAQTVDNGWQAVRNVVRRNSGTPGRELGTSPLREGASPLLPGELNTGTYNELVRAGRRGDNITPHHVPENSYMLEQGIDGYTRGKGVSINMEQPTPGSGGRHRATQSYGRPPELSQGPRDTLANAIQDLRRIYKNDGLYSGETVRSLRETIRRNFEAWPGFFNK